MDKTVCVRVRACVCVPGCVGLSRGRGDVEFLQSTAVSPGRGGEGACWRGNATAGTLREDGLFIRGKEGEGAVDRERERENERAMRERIVKMVLFSLQEHNMILFGEAKVPDGGRIKSRFRRKIGLRKAHSERGECMGGGRRRERERQQRESERQTKRRLEAGWC